MTIFTTITFMLCAYLETGLSVNHPTMIMIGNIDNGVCDPFMFFPDSHGQKAMVAGHEYGVDIYDSGAKLYFDNKIFYFVKDSI